MRIVLWILQVLLAVAFVLHGWLFLFPPAEMVEAMNASIAPGLRMFIGVAEWLAAIGLMLLMAFTLAWMGAIVGFWLKTVEAVNSIGFTLIFPLTFVSSTFINPDFLPGWLQGFAKNQPFTLMLDAVRGLLTGYPDVGNKGWIVTLWLLGALVVFVPAALWMFERRIKQ